MKKLLTFFVFLLCSILSFAQLEFYNESQQQDIFSEQSTDAFNVNIDSLMLDSMIIAYQNTYSIPGIATLILKDDQIIWDNNYGYRNRELQLPVEDSTLFLIASISKTIVATATMQLWENGMIGLESNINNYLPAGFTVVNPNHPNDTITVKMLMTHTSSLDDNWTYVLNPLVTCGDSPIQLDSFLVNYFTPGGNYYYQNYNFQNFYPGDYWHYANVNAGLLALIVENLTGKTFDEYCRDSIFIPLAMNSTSWFLEGMDTNKIAVPYDGPNPVCHQGSPLYPAGFLRTNTLELSNFLFAYMQNGIYNNSRILDSATVAYILTDQLGYPIYEIPGVETRQGLLWYNNKGIHDPAWGHGGSHIGCLTSMCFDPNGKWGFITFQNWRPVNSTYGPDTDIGQLFVRYAQLYGNIFAIRPYVDKSYVLQNVDSVLFRTNFSNIYNHQFTPYLIYTYPDSTILDSLTLFDDGMHGDSLSNDGIYGNYIPPQQTENFYYLGVSTIDNQTNKYFNTPDICRFTTAGPVKLDSIRYMKGAFDWVNVRPFVINIGNTLTITNASIRIKCDDPWVTEIGQSVMSFPDIPPGTTVGGNTWAAVNYIDTLYPGYFNIKVEIMVDGWAYWEDQIIVGVEDENEIKLPISFNLEQNYPNPFNPSTTINYSIAKMSKVTLTLYNLLGEEVKTLINEEKPTGNYSVEFNAVNLPSGVYFYRLIAGDFTSTKKMLILK